jgi:hypothetical protein
MSSGGWRARGSGLSAEEFFVYRNEVLDHRTIWSSIEAPSLLQITLFFFRDPFVLQQMLGPGCH